MKNKKKNIKILFLAFVFIMMIFTTTTHAHSLNIKNNEKNFFELKTKVEGLPIGTYYYEFITTKIPMKTGSKADIKFKFNTGEVKLLEFGGDLKPDSSGFIYNDVTKTGEIKIVFDIKPEIVWKKEEKERTFHFYILNRWGKFIARHDLKITKQVENKEDVVIANIPFSTVYIDDENLKEGVEVVHQEGVVGKKNIVTRYQIIDGVKDNSTITVEETIVKNPIDRIIKKGVKKDVVIENKEETTTSSIDFEVIYIYDENLKEGVETVHQEGVVGEKKIVTKYQIIDGVKDNSTITVEEIIVKKPVNKIIKKGVKKDIVIENKEVEEITTSRIDFEVIYIYDENLKEGVETVHQEGVVGKKNIVTRYQIIDGVKDNSTIIVEETIVKKPVNKIIKKGVKKNIVIENKEVKKITTTSSSIVVNEANQRFKSFYRPKSPSKKNIRPYILGYEDNTFRKNRNISNNELLVILARLTGFKEYNVLEDWKDEHIRFLLSKQKQNIMKLYNDNKAKKESFEIFFKEIESKINVSDIQMKRIDFIKKLNRVLNNGISEQVKKEIDKKIKNGEIELFKDVNFNDKDFYQIMLTIMSKGGKK